jgi:hypothetical protein
MKYKMDRYEPIRIDGVPYFVITKQYRGVLNPKNLPRFVANTWTFQAASGKVVTFHYCLN